MMKFSKTASVEELQVIGRFESLRKILHSDEYKDHLQKPLAYWALPTDRRLPLAFLGRTLEDLLNTPFSGTFRHAGNRAEKMCSFVKLLGPRGQHRSLGTSHTDLSNLPRETVEARGEQLPANGHGFDPGDGFGGRVGPVAGKRREPWFGRRKARSLRPQPPPHDARHLEHAAGGVHQSHARRNPRHENARRKAVRAILEVFHSVHTVVANMGTQPHLTVRLIPRLIDERRAVDRQRPANFRHSQPRGDLPTLCFAAAGANPHRCNPANRHPGRESPGRAGDHYQRSAGRAGHGAYPCPGVPVAQRNQRHHVGPLADGAAPGRTNCGRSSRPNRSKWIRRPTCINSRRRSNCSIRAVAAGPLDTLGSHRLRERGSGRVRLQRRRALGRAHSDRSA